MAIKRSPSALTKELMEADGWLIEMVERWIPGANIRKDLYGFIDFMCIKGEETLAIQCTSWANVSSRVKKIETSDTINQVRVAGWKIWVIGWKWDVKMKKWVYKIEDLS